MSADLVAILLDAVGVPVFVLDREGRVVRFNEACRELSGYTLEELRGTSLAERLLPEDEANGLRIACEQVFAGRSPLHHEHSWKRRDGGRRRLAWRLHALTDQAGAVACVVAAGHDVTEERRRAESHGALVASEELFRTVIENVPSGVLVADVQGRVVLANGPAQEWLALPVEAIGTRLEQWVPQGGELLSAPRRPGRRQLELQIADGTRRWIGFDTVSCPVAGGEGWLVVFRDLGEIRRADRRRRRAERLTQARALAAGLGQELQPAIGSVLAGAQFLEQEAALPAGSKLVLSTLSQSARKLSRAAQEYIEGVRSTVPAPRLLPLGKVMAEAMDPFVGLAASRAVKLEIVPSDGDLLLAVDPAHFRRAVGAVVSQAIEAAGREGRVHVEWKEPPFEMVRRRVPGFQGRLASIRVADGGPTVAEDDLRRVFRPFGNVRAGGGGFGLAAAYEIVEAHGGLLTVVSRPGEDTTFEILLPSGERPACWEHEQRPEGLCGVCALRTDGPGYCCWSVTGHKERAETGQWPERCRDCPVFRRWSLAAWQPGFTSMPPAG
ncbi:MAG: PAS domain-containing protein [Deltaproteobacteria bacterium]|nr:PAS domain-containing protein [Deltaproteobacteria bacterium]